MPSKSNREYRVWHSSEEEALRRGVKKHGLGAWEVIRTDPEFSVLSCRSGVQLKDKWRNLVKFKHVTQADIQALQRRTSGPWSKKYGLQQQQQQRKQAGDEQPADGAADKDSNPGASNQRPEEQQEDGASQPVTERPRRRTAAVRAYNFDTSSSSTSDPPGDDTRPQKRTCSAEDRRFGIYDQRRYEKLPSSPRDPQPQAPPSPTGGGGRVMCTCGVDFDDGQLMIECERCNCWAHPDCLERLQRQHPTRFRFTFENYICINCQPQACRTTAAHTARVSGSDTDGSDQYHQYSAPSRTPPTPPDAPAPLHWAGHGRRANQRYRPRNNPPPPSPPP